MVANRTRQGIPDPSSYTTAERTPLLVAARTAETSPDRFDAPWKRGPRAVWDARVVHPGPTGLVTFLFSDIEGSTLLWEARPDDMSQALSRHDAIVRGTIDPDYCGPTVNEAARVMAVAHGGQIVLTAATANLVWTADLVDLGDHLLKDIRGDRRLHQLAADGLQPSFPPPRTTRVVPGNLRTSDRHLIGRDRAVDAVGELVRTHRLVTLTGPGGIGKTHLAVHVADTLRGLFTGGVWMVDLAPITDADTVPQVVATTLRVTAPSGLSLTDALAACLVSRRLLLLVDNCEHVLRAVSDLVGTLLERVDTLTVLATSRQGLGLAAEHLSPVSALETAGGPHSPAVELFVERAQQLVPDFELSDPDDRAAVAEICHRLDGVPLAIELAAARMESMSPNDVRDRLDQRFRLLSGPRRALERHQTLRHAVGWSFDLLLPSERTVLEATSAFAAGFDLAAAVEVCGDDRDEYEVLDILRDLVRKSLLHLDLRHGRTRYGLLETIRQFAEERLVASGRSDERRHRHAEHMTERLARELERFDSPELAEALDWVDSEFRQCSGGLPVGDGPRRPHHRRTDRDQRCSARSGPTTLRTCHLGRGAAPVGHRRRACDPAGGVHRSRVLRPDRSPGRRHPVRSGGARPRARPAVHTRRRSEPPSLLLASAYAFSGAVDRALEICREVADNEEFRAQGLSALLLWSAFRGPPRRGARGGRTGSRRGARRGSPFWLAQTLWGYGRVLAEVDPNRAMAVYQEGLEYSRAHRLTFFENGFLREAAVLESRHGDPDRALDMLDEVLVATHTAGDATDFTIAMAHMARLLANLGQDVAAAVLAGWTDAQPSGRAQADHAQTVADLHTTLGAGIYDRSARAGADMDAAQALAFERDEVAARRQRRSPTS